MAESNVLESFFVNIFYNADEPGRKKMLSGLEAVQKRAAEATIVLERFALALLSYRTAEKAVDAVGSLAASFERLYYASKRTGSAAGELKAFQYAVSQLGGTAEGALSSLEALALKIRENPKGYAGYLKRFGVSDPSDATKTAEQVRKSLRSMPYWKGLQYSQDLGFDENSFRALISPEMDKFLGEYRAKMKAAGLDPEAAAANGKRLAQEWRSLSTSLDVLVDKALSKLFPEGNDPLKKLTDWIDANSEKITDAIDTVAKAIIDLAKHIGAFVQTETFKKFVDGFTDPENWKAFAKTLGQIAHQIDAIFSRLDGFFKSPAGKLILGKWGFGVTDDGPSLPQSKDVAGDSDSPDPFGIGGAIKKGYGWAKRKLGFGGGAEKTSENSAPSNAPDLTRLTEDEARRAGIDPRIMHGIRAGESGHGRDYDVGDGTGKYASSFGPWQLHYGGINPAMPHLGLGDDFTRDTGLDARDPKTIPQQTRWVANYLKTHSPRGIWFGYHGDRDADPRWGNSGYVPPELKKLPPMVRGGRGIGDGSAVPIPTIKPLPGTVGAPFGAFDPDALRRSLNLSPPASTGGPSVSNSHNTATQHVKVDIHGSNDPEKTSMALDRVLSRQKIFMQRNSASAIG